MADSVLSQLKSKLWRLDDSSLLLRDIVAYRESRTGYVGAGELAQFLISYFVSSGRMTLPQFQETHLVDLVAVVLGDGWEHPSGQSFEAFRLVRHLRELASRIADHGLEDIRRELNDCTSQLAQIRWPIPPPVREALESALVNAANAADEAEQKRVREEAKLDAAEESDQRPDSDFAAWRAERARIKKALANPIEEAADSLERASRDVIPSWVYDELPPGMSLLATNGPLSRSAAFKDADAHSRADRERTDTAVLKTNDDRPPVLRVSISATSARVTLGSETFANVNIAAAELLKFVIDGHPRPVGLTRHTSSKPKRVLKTLPEEIRNLLISSPQGYILDLNKCSIEQQTSAAQP